MNEYLKERNELLINTVIKNLEKRNFYAYYSETKEDALKQAVTLINKDDVTAWGGSVTLNEIKIKEYLENNGYKVLNRDTAKTSEEKNKLIFQSLTCDVFLTSTNAITEDGILVNVDGTGNRVAAISFGPKKVIFIVGANKIVKTLDDAISRARNIAAPINIKKVSVHYNIETPCQKTGVCLNCKSETSICTQILVTRLSNPKGRIHVILVNDELGF